MAHFARLEPTDNPDCLLVTHVIVINNNELLDENGNEVEELGRAFCEATFGYPNWKQCSYNAKFRHCYPNPGYYYVVSHDVFVQRPHWSEPPLLKGWVYNFNIYNWESPIPVPVEDPVGTWVWDEDTENWVDSPPPTI